MNTIRRKLNYRTVGLPCNETIYPNLDPTAKESQRTNRNMPARSTLVQLLALYTNTESQNAQCHRRTDRRTDNRMIVSVNCTVSFPKFHYSELLLPTSWQLHLSNHKPIRRSYGETRVMDFWHYWARTPVCNGRVLLFMYYHSLKRCHLFIKVS